MTISAKNNQKINKLLFGTPYRAGMHTVVRCESRLFTFYWFGFIGKFVSNSRERISIFSGQNPAVQEVWYSSLFPFYIRPVIIIPLISERHGRPLTKLLSQESNNFFHQTQMFLQWKSRTFCVVTSLTSGRATVWPPQADLECRPPWTVCLPSKQCLSRLKQALLVSNIVSRKLRRAHCWYIA